MRDLGLGRFDPFLAALSRAFWPARRCGRGLGLGLLGVVLFTGHAFRARRARVRSNSISSNFNSLAARAMAASTSRPLASCSATVAWFRASLRLEGDGVHRGDDLAGPDDVPLMDQDLRHPPRLLGRHVHLDRLDPPVACGEPRR